MAVCVRWNPLYDRCAATVTAVSEYCIEINELFEEMNAKLTAEQKVAEFFAMSVSVVSPVVKLTLID